MRILNRHCLQQNKTFEYIEIHLKVKMKSLSRVQLFATPRAVACTRLLRPWDFLGKSTGVGDLSLLQWMFPIQESNWGLLHCRWILYQPSYQGSPSKRYLLIYTILRDDCLKAWSYNLVIDILLNTMPAYDIKSFQLMKILVMFYFI